MLDRALRDGRNCARRIPAYRTRDDCPIHNIQAVLTEDTSGVIHDAIPRSVRHVAPAERVRSNEIAEKRPCRGNHRGAARRLG